MRIKSIVLIAVFVLFASMPLGISAQNKSVSKPVITRTKFKKETIEFGSGGTVTVTGAPVGSIEIEGWRKPEVEISAEIKVSATNEADLARIAAVCGFMIEDSMSQLRIVSVGTHDKKYLKKVDKKFPKRLRGSAFKVNYKIKVPNYTDLVIDGGVGDLNLSMVEGFMRIGYIKSNAKLNLIGGTVQATIGSGSVDVSFATRSWRGRFAEIKLAKGDMNVWLRQNMHANLLAKVLRTGKIYNNYKTLKPMRKTKFTDNVVRAKAGNGGAELLFTVGDGSLKIGDFEKIAKK